MTVHLNTIAYGLIPFNGRGPAAISAIGLRRNYPDYVKLLSKRTTSVQVQIDNNGITDFRINFGLITWRDLKKVRIKNVRRKRFLCLEVANPEIYLSKLSATKRKLAEIDNALGIPRIVIGFSSLEPSIDAVVKYIRVKYPEKVANSA